MSDDIKYKVIISEKATKMLITHVIFLANVSKDAAEKLVNAFDQATISLQHMPQRNPWLNYALLPFNKYRKLLFQKRYLLIYQTKDTTVYVDFILDCRQDYGHLI